MTEAVSGGPAPLLVVTRGAPTPEELAALVVVFATPPAASASADRVGPSAWSAKGRTLRATVRPGPGAWRASALPG